MNEVYSNIFQSNEIESMFDHITQLLSTSEDPILLQVGTAIKF